MDASQLTPIHMNLVQKALTKTTTVKVEEICLSWLQLSPIADTVTIDNQREKDAPLITLSVNDTRSINNKLLTQFILDPGSNIHMVNTKTWQGWTQTKTNTIFCTVTAGNSQIPITAWRTMDIVVKNSPTSYHLLRLTHVTFVPGFFTSLVSLSRCWTKDIHFNSETDLMYWTTSPTKSRTTIAILNYNEGHWLLDADLSCLPHIQDLNHKLSSVTGSRVLDYVGSL